MKYKIVQAKDIDSLEIEVNKLIEQGLRPEGACSFVKNVTDFGYIYLQTMVVDYETEYKVVQEVCMKDVVIKGELV